MYADKDKQRVTTRKRVQKHRAKGVTEGVTTKPRSLIFPDNMGKSPEELRELAHKIIETTVAICSACGGKGFIEREHGLVMVKCKECQE